jgi:hypothetical protein
MLQQSIVAADRLGKAATDAVFSHSGKAVPRCNRQKLSMYYQSSVLITIIWDYHALITVIWDYHI